MLAPARLRRLDALTADVVPEVDPLARGARPARGRGRGRGPAELRALAARNTRGAPDDRPGLLRHPHPGRHPAQRPREPRLVHRLHAVPAGDLARAGSRRCSTSRPWSRTSPALPVAGSSLLDEPTAAAEAMTLALRAARSRRARASSSTPTPTRRPSPCSQTRAEPLGIDVVVADLDERPARRRRRRRAASATRARPAASRDLAPRDRGRPRARGRSRSWPPTCWRSRCSPRPASSAPTSWSARRSASACRSASAARTPASCPCAPGLER